MVHEHIIIPIICMGSFKFSTLCHCLRLYFLKLEFGFWKSELQSCDVSVVGEMAFLNDDGYVQGTLKKCFFIISLCNWKDFNDDFLFCFVLI